MKTAIADNQINALRSEAAEHGDAAMVEICDLALGGVVVTAAVARRILAGEVSCESLGILS